MNKLINPIRLSFVVVALALAVGSSAWACPNCREALAETPQGQGLATGFYYSILFMMSMPFIVLGALVSVAYRSVQRAKVDQTDPPSVDLTG